MWAEHAEKSHSQTPTIRFCSRWDVSTHRPALGYPQRSGCLNQKQHAACWRDKRQSHKQWQALKKVESTWVRVESSQVCSLGKNQLSHTQPQEYSERKTPKKAGQLPTLWGRKPATGLELVCRKKFMEWMGLNEAVPGLNGGPWLCMALGKSLELWSSLSSWVTITTWETHYKDDMRWYVYTHIHTHPWHSAWHILGSQLMLVILFHPESYSNIYESHLRQGLLSERPSYLS